jgi:fluoroacetyl-CoA thioesterase
MKGWTMDDLTGLRAEREHTVAEADTARALGSGTVAVLGTPRLLALLEATTVAALDGRLDAGDTTVGTEVTLRHRRPSSVGSTVRTSAEVVAHSGRRVEFRVEARSAADAVLGEGTVVRAVVTESGFGG